MSQAASRRAATGASVHIGADTSPVARQRSFTKRHISLYTTSGSNAGVYLCQVRQRILLFGHHGRVITFWRLEDNPRRLSTAFPSSSYVRVRLSGCSSVTALKLVSILHPDLVGRAPLERLGHLEGADVTLIASSAIDAAVLPATTRLVQLQSRGRGLLADYGALQSALHGLDADVIHLHADPRSLLAFRVSRLCGPAPSPGLVLDCELDGKAARRSLWKWLARQTLTRADAIIARDRATLGQIRGPLRGLALVARRGEQPDKPARACCRSPCT